MRKIYNLIKSWLTQEVDENYNPVMKNKELSPFIRAEIKTIIENYARDQWRTDEESGETMNKLDRYKNKSIYIENAYNEICKGKIGWKERFLTHLYRAVNVDDD